MGEQRDLPRPVVYVYPGIMVPAQEQERLDFQQEPHVSSFFNTLTSLTWCNSTALFGKKQAPWHHARQMLATRWPRDLPRHRVGRCKHASLPAIWLPDASRHPPNWPKPHLQNAVDPWIRCSPCSWAWCIGRRLRCHPAVGTSQRH